MDCRRAEELFSDHLEGVLHEILKAGLEAHLASCEACRELRDSLGEVVSLLHEYPEVEAPPGLAVRVARAALARGATATSATSSTAAGGAVCPGASARRRREQPAPAEGR